MGGQFPLFIFFKLKIQGGEKMSDDLENKEVVEEKAPVVEENHKEALVNDKPPSAYAATSCKVDGYKAVKEVKHEDKKKALKDSKK